MSSENKESEKIRSNSLSGDAGGGSKKFYFLNTAAPSPASSKVRNQERNYQSIQNEEKLELGQSTRQGDNEWSWMNPFSWGQENNGYQKVKSPATREKPRKVPVKVEPKVFFANERTFLAWLHMAVTLASISMAIVAFADSNQWSQLYGLLLMPVSIAFCVYSLWVYMKRASMIRRRDPGPYEDKVGPVVLGVLLAVSIIVNFVVKLYDIAY